MAARLKPLPSEIVFVGGCAAGLLITDPAGAAMPAHARVYVTADVFPLLKKGLY